MFISVMWDRPIGPQELHIRVRCLIVAAVRITNPDLSSELLMIALPYVGWASINCPPTRFVVCVFIAAVGSTGCDAT